MMTNKLPFQIAVGILLLIGIAHLLRVVFNVAVTVGQYHVPMTISIIADIATFGMAWWLWRSIK